MTIIAIPTHSKTCAWPRRAGGGSGSSSGGGRLAAAVAEGHGAVRRPLRVVDDLRVCDHRRCGELHRRGCFTMTGSSGRPSATA